MTPLGFGTGSGRGREYGFIGEEMITSTAFVLPHLVFCLGQMSAAFYRPRSCIFFSNRFSWNGNPHTSRKHPKTIHHAKTMQKLKTNAKTEKSLKKKETCAREPSCSWRSILEPADRNQRWFSSQASMAHCLLFHVISVNTASKHESLNQTKKVMLSLSRQHKLSFKQIPRRWYATVSRCYGRQGNWHFFLWRILCTGKTNPDSVQIVRQMDGELDSLGRVST